MKNEEEAKRSLYQEVIKKCAGNHFELSGRCWIGGAAALTLEAYDSRKKRWIIIKILWRDNVGDIVKWRESLEVSLEYLVRLLNHPIAVDLIYPKKEVTEWVSNPELPFLVLESLNNPQNPTSSSLPLGPTSPIFPSISELVYRRPGWLPLWEILDLSSQYAQFLIYLHKNGMTYPDIKPIHAYWSGHHLRIIDFNCCEPIAPQGQSIPEQSQRDDIGLFGYLLLYPMLTGKDPDSQLPLDRLALTLSTRSSLRYQIPDQLTFSGVDELIPQEVKQLAFKTISQQYPSASALSQAIIECRRSLCLIGENPDPWQKLRQVEAILRENREAGRQMLELLRREWELDATKVEARHLEARRLAVMSTRDMK